ncbi:hypothetical protein CYLTODRAFT_373514 [Cylindrobasidium torrendii FP15055 ss-10]|uniref:C2H2-type domain-containing protein n=1 Tax=Cylindrobasidium torrendii FP15055 ss-10 TaxID=1314674 RepID=A0A0D7BER0_9AGAR|nr:hypothetical protein CYLTODRAFT_373514 [Cylindrobasidium torrendii FP15055 ss-10]
MGGDADPPPGDARPFACDWPDCAYRALKQCTLIRHKRIHTGERPFACTWPKCTYAAAQWFTLDRHRRTHTGDRPYACHWPHCTYRSTQSGAVRKHEKRHAEGNLRDFECPYCNYKDSDPTKLNNHVKSMHFGGRKMYNCLRPGCVFHAAHWPELEEHEQLCLRTRCSSEDVSDLESESSEEQSGDKRVHGGDGLDTRPKKRPRESFVAIAERQYAIAMTDGPHSLEDMYPITKPLSFKAPESAPGTHFPHQPRITTNSATDVQEATRATSPVRLLTRSSGPEASVDETDADQGILGLSKIGIDGPFPMPPPPPLPSILNRASPTARS